MQVAFFLFTLYSVDKCFLLLLSYKQYKYVSVPVKARLVTCLQRVEVVKSFWGIDPLGNYFSLG